MARDVAILRQVIEAQRTLLRVATDPLRHGFTFKSLALSTGLPESTLRSYARVDAPAEMPLHVVWLLAEALPAELVTGLLPPGLSLVADGPDPDFDDTAVRCIDFAGAHARARHPESEAGVAIGRGEAGELRAKAAQLGGGR